VVYTSEKCQVLALILSPDGYCLVQWWTDKSPVVNGFDLHSVTIQQHRHCIKYAPRCTQC